MMATHEMCGSSQRRNGIRNREVCWAEPKSVEAAKITIIQASTGIHVETKRRGLMFNESGAHAAAREQRCAANVSIRKVGKQEGSKNSWREGRHRERLSPSSAHCALPPIRTRASRRAFPRFVRPFSLATLLRPRKDRRP